MGVIDLLGTMFENTGDGVAPMMERNRRRKIYVICNIEHNIENCKTVWTVLNTLFYGLHTRTGNNITHNLLKCKLGGLLVEVELSVRLCLVRAIKLSHYKNSNMI